MRKNRNDKTKDAGPQKLSLQSAIPAEEKLRQLKRLFPEAFAETQTIDFERLKTALGQFFESAGQPRERYGLSWPGKNECLKIIQQASAATLKPRRNQSVRFETTQNLFIEGDNLEALKLLQKAYSGQVKSIYIDPPYNTGKDFVYQDNWKTPLKEYLRQTGQLDANGKRLQTAETNGRKHSRWLSMMYPRLYLARNLLADNGVVFISIDDHESHNLRHLLDEIFGPENFIATFSWHSKHTISNDAQQASRQHEYIACYCKDIDEFNLNLLPRTEKTDAAYKNPDNDERGVWMSTPIYAKSGRDKDRYSITFPNGVVWGCPTGRFPRFNKTKLLELYHDNRLWFGKTGKTQPTKKLFLTEVKQGKTAGTVLHFKEVGSTHEANEDISKLLGKGMYENPKPVRLVEHLLRLSTSPKSEDLVMDFFAGSCTTAHAVMKLNKEDGGNRRFIMVQLPEPYSKNSEAFKAGFKTIADIGKERIARASKQLGDSTGFKVFRLDESNFQAWDNAPPKNGKELQKRLEMHVNHLNPKSSKEDVLYEILLKAGHPLTTQIEKKEMAGTKIYSVESGKLFLCLEKLTLKAVHAMAKAEPQEVICLDSCFAGNDELKTNAYYYFKCRSTVPGDYPEILFRTV